MFGAQSAATVKQARERSRALKNDPLTAIKGALALPPQSITYAPFIGNATVIEAPSANGLVMARQPDCSLSAGNVPYNLNLSDPYLPPVSETPGYDQLLHIEAGLTTTGGQYNGKCPDPTTGISASAAIYIGTSKNGMRMGAATAYLSSTGNNGIYTYIFNSSGAFVSATPQTLPGNSNPSGLVAGDVNGDGNPDLVVIGYPAGVDGAVAVTVLLGNADGAFTIGQTYTVGYGIYSGAVIDDFNGDGKLDIVVPLVSSSAQPQTGSLAFFKGNGDGTFVTPTTFSTTSALDQQLISADFNGDGKKDIAGDSGHIYLGNGAGSFTQVSTPAFSGLQALSDVTGVQLAAGDFNKDGKQDLVAGTGESIYIYLGKGDGTFNPGNVYAGISNDGSITATDLDGDGNLDLYSGLAHAGIFSGDDALPNEGYALMGRGDGTFIGAPVVDYSSFSTLQDLNGDGKLDFIGLTGSASATADPMTPTFTTYYGSGNGAFKPAGTPLPANFTYNSIPYNVYSISSYLAADLNGDGHADLLYEPGSYNGAGAPYGFVTALGTGNGSFQTPTFTPVPSLLQTPVGPGDEYYLGLGNVFGATNQNGKFEILYSYGDSAYNPSNNSVSYYLGYATQVSNGDGTFAAPALTVVSTTAPGSNPDTPPDPTSIADLNGDKIPDLIIYNLPVYGSGGTVTTPASLQVLLGKSDGTFGPPTTISAVPNPVGTIALADFNGDGIPDLVAEATSPVVNNSFYYELVVALGKGDGTFQAKTTLQLTNITFDLALAAADVNGDGKADIASIGTVIAGITPVAGNGVFIGNGDGTFQTLPSGYNDGSVVPPLVIGLDSGVGGPVGAYDLNGDGKLSILAGNTFFVPTSAVTILNTSATTLKASAASITAGQNLTLTATIAATSGSGTPTGTVTFLDGSTALGTGTLNSSSVANFSTTSLAAGTHTITASYSGDANFAASTSTAVSVTVTAPPALTASTTTLAASATTATAGQSITLSATVKQPSGDVTVPSGTVTFLNGTDKLGTGTLNSSGVATFTTTTLPTGSDSITAQYGGDTNFATSTSSAVVITVTVAAPDFTLSLSPESATVASGSSTTTTLSIQPSGGFTQAVSFACSGLPSNTTCSFAPTTVTPTGASAATTTLTLNTTSTAARLDQDRLNKTLGGRGTIALAFTLLGLSGLVSARRRLHRILKNTPMVCLLGLCLLGLLSGLTGCGGSSPKSSPVTSTITITATAGSLSHTATFTLTVQ
jgi:hypothetical protein